MQPYDWCNPRCPWGPCWCEETIEANRKREQDTEAARSALAAAASPPKEDAGADAA